MPWAAVAAALVVVAGERLAFSWPGAWESLGARLAAVTARRVHVEEGIVADRLELAALRAAPDELPRVLILGSSRAKYGLLVEEGGASDLAVARIAHAPVDPFLMRQAVGETRGLDLDAAVLLLSEFDTHRPLELVPRAGFGDLGATWDLAARLGWRAAGAHRRDLERTALAALSPTYRYRDVLDAALLDDWLRFEPGDEGRFPTLEVGEEDFEPPDVPGLRETRQAMRRLLGRPVRNWALAQVAGIRTGEHVPVQEGLVEDTVRRLRAEGVRVLLVEGPLLPLSWQLYDRGTTRAEFLDFARRLARDPGVELLPLEESGPFPDEAFLDLLHLGPPAGRRLGALALQRVRAMLERE